MAQASRIVSDHGLVKYVDAKLAQSLRDELRIRVDNVAEQDLGSDGDQFCIHNCFSFRAVARIKSVCVIRISKGGSYGTVFRI